MFLVNPVARWSPHQSMYSLSFDEIENAVRFLVPEDSKSDRPVPHPKQIDRGAELFRKYRCAQCHGVESIGPRIDLGVPLLTWEYFRAKLTGELKLVDKSMPDFDLSKDDLENLYQFVSYGQQLEALGEPSKSYPDDLMTLYRQGYEKKVLPLIKGSCRHCHSIHNQKEIAEVLGRSPSEFFLTGEKGRFAVKQFGIFTPKKPCHASDFVLRLQERHKEWRGSRKQSSSLVGMPMTLAPIDRALIQDIHLWTTMGCPVGGVLQCAPCSTKQESFRSPAVLGENRQIE
jgi:hypothetical protein